MRIGHAGAVRYRLKWVANNQWGTLLRDHVGLPAPSSFFCHPVRVGYKRGWARTLTSFFLSLSLSLSHSCSLSRSRTGAVLINSIGGVNSRGRDHVIGVVVVGGGGGKKKSTGRTTPSHGLLHFHCKYSLWTAHQPKKKTTKNKTKTGHQPNPTGKTPKKINQ